MAKTIKVVDIIARVNARNRCSTCPAETRQGWNSLLEEILAATDNYAGFGFLNENEIPQGEKPGIAGNGTFPDESRRTYCIHPRLRT
jgi:hypothetical protein